MSIEEKAKAYDEAIEKAKEYFNSPRTCFDIEQLCNIFPELTESEDMIMVKFIKNQLFNIKKTIIENYELDAKLTKAIDWLEKQGNNMGISEVTKQELEDNLNNALEQETPESCNEFLDEQGEQKTTIEMITPEESLGIDSDTYNKIVDECVYGEQKPDWSEEDETTKNNISHIIRQYDKISKKENQPCWYVGDCLLWMQNIKDRVQPKPKQEWSGGDEAHLHSLITHLEQWIERHPNTTGADIQGENITWLKSLRPKNTWKPSDEQMDALESAIVDSISSIQKHSLESLYNELKKLF